MTERRTNMRQQSAFRFEQLNAFADGTLAALSRGEIATWLLLFRDARPPQWQARTSLDDLARRGGMNRSTASRAVGRLKARGLLEVTRRGGLNAGPSTYRVTPFRLDE